jgi:hypothetical protein
MVTFKIYRGNQVIKEFNNQDSDFVVLKFMLNHQSSSMHHALKYEGYKVEQIDEETKKNHFWTIGKYSVNSEPQN